MANENLKRKNTENVSPLATKQQHRRQESDNKNLTDLPNEILGKITDMLCLKDLFILERVNKRMQEIALDVAWPRRHTLDKESINHCLNPEEITNNNYKVYDKLIETILSRANIKYFDLSKYLQLLNFRKIFTYRICFQLRMAPKLIKLNLPRIDLTNDRLKIISFFCPLLEHAAFPHCSSKEKLDEGLEFFFKGCPNIIYLDLYENNFSGECFAYIPKKLRYLNLYFCDSVTSSAMELLSKNAKDLETLILHDFKPTEDVNLWLTKFTKLRFLRFSLLDGNLPSLNLSQLQQLEMLCLFGNSLATAEILKSLKYCPNLKGLDIGCNPQLDNNDILKELISCKALIYCNFTNLKNLNNDIVNFVQTLELEYLAINYCEDLLENVIKSLITECNSLSQLEIYSDFKDYNKILPMLLSDKNIHRSNILKLIVKKGNQEFPPCDWCEVSDPSPEPQFAAYEGINKAIYESNPSL